MKVTNAIILAGGRGERLRPLTDDCPKSMIRIGAHPLLFYNLQWLKKHGIKQIAVSCGYLHEVIRDYFQDGSSLGLNISYSIEDKPLGRGGGAKLASKLLSDDENAVLVINGDMLTDLSLLNLFNHHFSAPAAVTVVSVPLRSPYGILEYDNDYYVTHFTEKPMLPHWINAGIYVVNHELLAEFPNKGDHEETLFPRLAKEHKLRTYSYSGFWRTVDTAKDLTDLSRELDLLSMQAT